jgi:hypothetical protein
MWRMALFILTEHIDEGPCGLGQIVDVRIAVIRRGSSRSADSPLAPPWVLGTQTV